MRCGTDRLTLQYPRWRHSQDVAEVQFIRRCRLTSEHRGRCNANAVFVQRLPSLSIIVICVRVSRFSTNGRERLGRRTWVPASMNASARLINHLGSRTPEHSLLDGCVAARAPLDVDLLSPQVSLIDDSESSVCQERSPEEIASTSNLRGEALPGTRVQS